jgi:predicted nucleotide-binding protein
MARSRRQSPSPGAHEPGLLTAPRERFAAELDERIKLGTELLERQLGSRDEVKAAQSDYFTWSDYNKELLRRRFTTSEIADGYSSSAGMFILGDQSLAQEIQEHRDDVAMRLRRLESIRERLPLFEETAQATAETSAQPVRRNTGAPQSIFIVHGRDDAAKLAVHGFLRDVTSLEPVILHDQPNRGRTIIEKFEAVASAAAFAVVLLTPDDVGGKNADEPLPRARQNVVFELGFFVGVLGRARVAVLHSAGVELPSDIDGVVYTELDDNSAWKLSLARELKDADIDVDANRLL